MNRINILMLLQAFLLATLMSCSNKEGNREENTEASVSAPEKEMVRVIPLEKKEISRSIEYSATLEPYNEVHLAPSTPGKIEEIRVEIGDNVNKGDVLVKMDDAQLVQSKIQMNNIHSDFSRLDTLKKVGSIAQQQFDQVATQYEVAQKNVEFLSENTTITAPFSGVISGRYFENGEVYSGAPVAPVGRAAIVSLIQINRLKAMVSISENLFPKLKKGMVTAVKADVYPDTGFKGEIIRIYPTVNPLTRSFEAEIRVNNPDNLLRPGMFVRVTIDLEKTEAIVLPAIAVLKMQGSNVRYLFVEENGKAKRVLVTLGKRFDDKVEVLSDELKVGEKIVIDGQSRLLDGMEVQVVD